MIYFTKVFAFKVSALYICSTIKANGYETPINDGHLQGNKGSLPR